MPSHQTPLPVSHTSSHRGLSQRQRALLQATREQLPECAVVGLVDVGSGEVLAAACGDALEERLELLSAVSGELMGPRALRVDEQVLRKLRACRPAAGELQRLIIFSAERTQLIERGAEDPGTALVAQCDQSINIARLISIARDGLARLPEVS